MARIFLKNSGGNSGAAHVDCQRVIRVHVGRRLACYAVRARGACRACGMCVRCVSNVHLMCVRRADRPWGGTIACGAARDVRGRVAIVRRP